MTNTFRFGLWPVIAVLPRSELKGPGKGGVTPPLLGIIAAMTGEMRCYERHVVWESVSKVGVLAAISGIGSRNAEAAGKLLISRGATALVSWGCAAALKDDISPGDLIVPDIIVHSQGTAYSTDQGWSERIRNTLSGMKVYSDTLAETDRILATPQQKSEFAERTGARACDMESAALARLAHEQDIPFVAIRAVADTAAMSIPPAMLTEMTEIQAGSNTTNLLRAALLHPGDWLKLLILGISFRKAQSSLRQVAERTGRRLCA